MLSNDHRFYWNSSILSVMTVVHTNVGSYKIVTAMSQREEFGINYRLPFDRGIK